ncbi:hypothetical protein GOP47_0014934 [Adiantum capillus-veneris]|uniref:Uncharacterized protein n=1 Tax=Adiantum capillus-veneris TaxID=13818 RepID=A0A9D4UN54_ADICA|nr:hypothetical protein GOP47_0014934 [Adiantum capillus-veneris]
MPPALSMSFSTVRILANGTTACTVEHIHPAWAIDTSKLSSSAISRDIKVHYMKRTNCLCKFSELFKGLTLKKWELNSRGFVKSADAQFLSPSAVCGRSDLSASCCGDNTVGGDVRRESLQQIVLGCAFFLGLHPLGDVRTSRAGARHSTSSLRWISIQCEKKLLTVSDEQEATTEHAPHNSSTTPTGFG